MEYSEYFIYLHLGSRNSKFCDHIWRKSSMSLLLTEYKQLHRFRKRKGNTGRIKNEKIEIKWQSDTSLQWHMASVLAKISVIVVFSYQQIGWIIRRNNYYCLSGGGGGSQCFEGDRRVNQSSLTEYERGL